MSSPSGARVVVTGGAGFIGSELTAQLVDAGASVTVVDNLATGSRQNLERLGGQVRLVVADVRHPASFADVLRQADVVFHLACLGVRHSILFPYENHEVNAAGTLALLELARKSEASRVVYVSSSEVYGTAAWAPMTEEHPTFPMTVYGASKLAGECYARAFHRTYAYPTVVVRPFNTYGPRCHHEGERGEVIPKFMLRCLAGQPLLVFGDGSQTRDFTYVSDTARGILQAGFCDEAIGQTINLGRAQEVAVKDLAYLVARAVGVVNPTVIYDDPRPGDVYRLCAETSLARRLFGYQPVVPLEEGLKNLYEWYAQLGRSPEELLREERARNWETVDEALEVPVG